MLLGWLRRWQSRKRMAILQALKEAPRSTGADIMRMTGISSGSLYPILIVAEERGLVESWWGLEKIPEGPRSRHYRLSPAGLKELEQLTQEAER